MLVIGVDFHSCFQQIAMVDTETGEVVKRRLDHSNGQVEKFYAGLQKPVRVGMEATGYAIPAGPMELVRSSVSIVSGLPCETVRSAPAIVVSGPAQRLLTMRPARSPSRHATLYTESSDSFVASAAASIATGWSEPVPGRELHPLKSTAFSRRTVSPTGGSFPSISAS